MVALVALELSDIYQYLQLMLLWKKVRFAIQSTKLFFQTYGRKKSTNTKRSPDKKLKKGSPSSIKIMKCILLKYNLFGQHDIFF